MEGEYFLARESREWARMGWEGRETRQDLPDFLGPVMQRGDFNHGSTFIDYGGQVTRMMRILKRAER